MSDNSETTLCHPVGCEMTSPHQSLLRHLANASKYQCARWLLGPADVVSPATASFSVTLTSGFDFHHSVSYQYSIITIYLKCTIFELGACDRRTDGWIGASINAPYRGAEA